MAQSNCSSQMLFYFNDSIRKRANYKHMTSVHLCCGSVHSSSLAQLMCEAQLCPLNGPKSLTTLIFKRQCSWRWSIYIYTVTGRRDKIFFWLQSSCINKTVRGFMVHLVWNDVFQTWYWEDLTTWPSVFCHLIILIGLFFSFGCSVQRVEWLASSEFRRQSWSHCLERSLWGKATDKLPKDWCHN